MIEHLKKIGYKAGTVIRDAFGTDYSIEYKTSVANLVTEIDKKSEKIITDYILENFPDHGILAEESGASNEEAEFVWVIDPLDGTTNFAHGLPIVGVSIGLQQKGRTVCGIVYHVMNDVMYWAESGKGAYKNGRSIKVSSNRDIRKSLLVTGFPYDIADNPSNALEIFSDMVKTSRGMRRLGAASIDFCYVAEGVFDGFWEVNLQPWDVCAGALIVEEAGGKVTNFSGGEHGIHSHQCLATNANIHNSMIEIIAKHGK